MTTMTMILKWLRSPFGRSTRRTDVNVLLQWSGGEVDLARYLLYPDRNCWHGGDSVPTFQYLRFTCGRSAGERICIRCLDEHIRSCQDCVSLLLFHNL